MKDDQDYIHYGQTETRDHDNTKTNWWVALFGYSHIKRGDVVNAQVRQSNSQGYEEKSVYKPEYKSMQYNEEYNPVYNAGYKPTQNKEAYNIKPDYRSEYKPSALYKEWSIKPVYKPIQYMEECKSFYDNAGYEAEVETRN